MDKRPIGMFDSGCGGLTVLKEYTKLMPNEDFIYYGDTAHLPYGDKSPQEIIGYSKKIVEFLLKKDVKLIVIACGTASATAYEYLKSNYNIEIRNIIEPVATSNLHGNIGVIATTSTIKSNAWEISIKKLHNDVNVISLACPIFVPLIENGLTDTPVMKESIKEYMKSFNDNNINSLILGCTHYPLIQEKIQQELGPNINLINVGKYSAKNTLEFLKSSSLQNDFEHSGSCLFFSSGDFNAFKSRATFLGF